LAAPRREKCPAYIRNDSVECRFCKKEPRICVECETVAKNPEAEACEAKARPEDSEAEADSQAEACGGRLMGSIYDSTEIYQFVSSNLHRPLGHEFSIDDKVRVTKEGSRYEGQQGTILMWSEMKQKWRVEFPDGTKRVYRASHLKKIIPVHVRSSSSSPPTWSSSDPPVPPRCVESVRELVKAVRVPVHVEKVEEEEEEDIASRSSFMFAEPVAESPEAASKTDNWLAMHRKRMALLRKKTTESRRLGSPRRLAADNLDPTMAFWCLFVWLTVGAAVYLYELHVTRCKRDAMQRGKKWESSLDSLTSVILSYF